MKNDKQVKIQAQRILLFLLLLAVSSRCTQPAVERQATGPCRIRQVDATETIIANSGGIIPNETVDRTTYDYDEAGRVTHTLMQRQQTQQTRVINDYGVEQTYTYDAAGFLTALVEKTRWKTEQDGGSYEQRTAYTYSNGRLTESAQQFLGDPRGVVSLATSTYTYDAAGALTRLTTATSFPNLPDSLKGNSSYQNGLTTIRTYQNGRLTDWVEKNGNVEVRPYKLQNGLATTFTQSNSQTVYTYDGQDRISKEEYWADGQLKNETVYSYTDVKQATDTWPAFKGFPVTLGVRGKSPLQATNDYRSKLPNGAYYTSGTKNQYTQTSAGYVLTATTTDIHTNYDSRNGSYTTKRISNYAYDGFCD